jgi:hypothetical protein
LKGVLCNNFVIVGYFDYENATKMEKIVEKIRSYHRIEWFMNQSASWNSVFAPEFTEILTKQGFGSVFNMLPESELLTDK